MRWAESAHAFSNKSVWPILSPFLFFFEINAPGARAHVHLYQEKRSERELRKLSWKDSPALFSACSITGEEESEQTFYFRLPRSAPLAALCVFSAAPPGTQRGHYPILFLSEVKCFFSVFHVRESMHTSRGDGAYVVEGAKDCQVESREKEEEGKAA